MPAPLPDPELAELRQAVEALTRQLGEMHATTGELTRRVEAVRQAEITTPPLVFMGRRGRL